MNQEVPYAMCPIYNKIYSGAKDRKNADQYVFGKVRMQRL